ncbi:MAG: Gfo/Idh/MocA family oxidoreductase [Pirellulales bacterium]|nr:Gfo/Idh/MocA family oxidoreductase [Pirellulales bacterium]
MTTPICRWGILGAAHIARKNWQAIRLAENCTLTAVASRDLARCRQFIDQCQAHVAFDPPPRAVGRYEELLASDEVDAVYIPLPTAVRKEWAIRAAEAGKHVLSEKPAGAAADDVREILDACRRNNVQFMDGVMFMHSRRLDRIREVLDDGRSIGRIKRIVSQFTFGAPEEFFQTDIRMNSRLEPLGCLGDLGWYNIRFTLWAMNELLPQSVCGHMLAERGRPDSPSPVPIDFSAELFFPGGVSAGCYCSFITGIQQWANLSGTSGYLHVSDFVLPHYGAELAFDVSNPIFNISGCDFNMEDHTRRFAVHEYSNAAATAQETNMFRTFAGLVLGGKPDPYWGEIALKTQLVLDGCLRSAREGGKLVELVP